MKNATIVKMGPCPIRGEYTSNPMNRTVIMSIKKAKRRRLEIEREVNERKVSSGKFNSIRGLDKLRG